jgi:hypothetical protein
VTDLGEDLLLLGIALVFEGNHLVGGTEFRVPPAAAASPRELGHPDRSVISAPRWEHQRRQQEREGVQCRRRREKESWKGA